MKISVKNTLTLIKAFSAVLIAAFCIFSTGPIRNAVSDAVARCLTTVIPSLYGMMIIAAFLTESGILMRFPRFVSFIGKKLFGMEAHVFSVFLFSMFAGYPTGAKMLCGEYEQGLLSRRDAGIFTGICYGAGPAFIFGCISTRLYSTSSAGILIVFSTAAANLILAWAVSLFIRKDYSVQPAKTPLRFDSNTLNDCIFNAGRSMYSICIMICAFSVIIAFFEETGLINILSRLIYTFSGTDSDICKGFIRAFLDITAIDTLPHNNYRILPSISAVVSFGGVCVIMQIAALTAGRIRILPLIAMRCISAVLSSIICKAAMPFFINDIIISASDISVSAHQNSSPLPSVILIIMTLILFRDYDKLNNI